MRFNAAFQGHAWVDDVHILSQIINFGILVRASLVVVFCRVLQRFKFSSAVRLLTRYQDKIGFMYKFTELNMVKVYALQ